MDETNELLQYVFLGLILAVIIMVVFLMIYLMYRCCCRRQPTANQPMMLNSMSGTGTSFGQTRDLTLNQLVRQPNNAMVLNKNPSVISNLRIIAQ